MSRYRGFRPVRQTLRIDAGLIEFATGQASARGVTRNKLVTDRLETLLTALEQSGKKLRDCPGRAEAAMPLELHPLMMARIRAMIECGRARSLAQMVRSVLSQRPTTAAR